MLIVTFNVALLSNNGIIVQAFEVKAVVNMLLQEVVVAAFSVVNTFRILAYLPQIVAVCRDNSGVRSVATSTWLLFLISHVTTVAYALVVVDDWRMAAIFAANGACCIAIVGLTLWKRAVYSSGTLAKVAHSWRMESRSAVARLALFTFAFWIGVIFWMVVTDQTIAFLERPPLAQLGVR